MTATWIHKTIVTTVLVFVVLQLVGCVSVQPGQNPRMSLSGPSVTAIDPMFTPFSVLEGNNLRLIEIDPVERPNPASGSPGGYLTTPGELHAIAERAEQGVEPYHTALAEVLSWANRPWDYHLREEETCLDADDPAWNDDKEGTAILYAKALAYHLTGDDQYAQEVKMILQRIMTEVKIISLEERRCQLTFGWGAPELVAAADLIDGYWQGDRCTGPTSTLYADTTLGPGNCKRLFQNWLVKNPYYVVSYAAEGSANNWGAAATNATAYIADYVSDRENLLLIHRSPPEKGNGDEVARRPAEAFVHANQLALARMNGYGTELASKYSCDFLSGEQHSVERAPAKSQITAGGIIPEEARRQEQCNTQTYNGEYQNYPQLHIGHNVQQCELMLRRGDRSCYDNMDNSDIPDFVFVDPYGETKRTHLYPGRGSIERAINAVIVDSGTEWRHDSALAVAYRYYRRYGRFSGVESWSQHIDRPADCSQDVCFGKLTHGVSLQETLELPPTAPPLPSRPETRFIDRSRCEQPEDCHDVP